MTDPIDLSLPRKSLKVQCCPVQRLICEVASIVHLHALDMDVPDSRLSHSEAEPVRVFWATGRCALRSTSPTTHWSRSLHASQPSAQMACTAFSALQAVARLAIA